MEIAVAEYEGNRGWPILTSVALIDETPELGSLDALLDAHAESAAIVGVYDVGAVTDVYAEGFTAERGKTLAKTIRCTNCTRP